MEKYKMYETTEQQMDSTQAEGTETETESIVDTAEQEHGAEVTESVDIAEQDTDEEHEYHADLQIQISDISNDNVVVTDPKADIPKVTIIDPKKEYQPIGPEEVADEAWRLIYAAKNNNNPLVDYPATGIEEILGEKCLIIYIPDPLTGVKGILPERHAGLRGNERLESLMNYPFLRVLPTRIDRDSNIVSLRRDRAEAIRAAWAWNQIEKGDIVESVVTGVDRAPNGRAYRVYLDIEAIRAILPISEVSHNYVEDVDYKRGDILKVKVISKDEISNTDEETGQTTTRRVLMASLRALTPDPWQLEHCIPIAKMPYYGTVVNIVQTGMFVRLVTGIEVKTPHPSLNYRGNVSVGDRIRVYPVTINREERRVYGVLTEAELKRTVRMYEARRKRKENQSSGGIS